MRNQGIKKHTNAENSDFLMTLPSSKIISICTKSIKYKLFKSIKDIVFQGKIKILISKVKMILRQYITSYFDDSIFQFKCQHRLYVSVYHIDFYIVKKYTKFYKLWYIKDKPYAHKFKDQAVLLLRCPVFARNLLTDKVEKAFWSFSKNIIFQYTGTLTFCAQTYIFFYFKL